MQGWNLLIRSLLICSFAKNLSGQMSECEQFAQVSLDKWATVSKSLRSLMTNKQMWAIRSGCSGQMSKLLGFLSKSLIFSFAYKKWAIPSKTFYRFLKFLKMQKVRSFLLSVVSKLLRSIRTNKWPWMICSGCSEGMRDREQIAQVTHLFRKNEQFAPKFDERSPHPELM